HLLMERTNEVISKVTGIALTDSHHATIPAGEPKEFMLKKCKHWIVSHEKLDSEILEPDPHCIVVSGGTTDPAKINSVVMESVFRFFGELTGATKKRANEEPAEQKKAKKQKKEKKTKKKGFSVTGEIDSD